MTCPHCSAAIDSPTLLGALTVCQSCARTLVLDGESVRLATADDTAGADIAALKKLRPKAWREATLARKRAIVGGRAR